MCCTDEPSQFRNASCFGCSTTWAPGAPGFPGGGGRLFDHHLPADLGGGPVRLGPPFLAALSKIPILGRLLIWQNAEPLSDPGLRSFILFVDQDQARRYRL